MSSSLSVVHVLAVFVGSGVGGVVRYLLQRGGVVVFGADRPWATLLINVAGSLLIGALFGWFSTRPQLEAHKLFALTGVLGGFTTFSAFSLDAAQLWQRGDTTLAVVYVLVSVLLSLLAVAAGLAIARG